MTRIVYHPRYNLGFPGSQRLHPFDLRKYARTWRVLHQRLGSKLRQLHLPVERPVSEGDLQLVHTPAYLASLCQSAVIADAIEVPALRRAPWWLLDRFVLQPMRWATSGSILAGRAALEHGLVFNLGGGFHHAKPSRGEGFSIYNDIAVMVAVLRRDGLLTPTSRIAYIDLDAHLGNGVAWCFLNDPTVFMFDMHNGAIYPTGDQKALHRVDCRLTVSSHWTGEEYLQTLRERLPQFCDSISRSAPVELAIYNAGTDVLAEDALGGLSLSLENVSSRDQYVLQLLRQHATPTVVLTSGGYSSQSYQAIANMILAAVTT